MSDQTDQQPDDQQPDYGVVGEMWAGTKPILDSVATAFYGEDGVKKMREEAQAAAQKAVAAAEAEEERTAQRRRRSEYRARLRTIQETAVAVAVIIACVLLTAMGFEIWRILSEVTP